MRLTYAQENMIRDLIIRQKEKHYLSDDAKARLTIEAENLIASYREDRVNAIQVLEYILKSGNFEND